MSDKPKPTLHDRIFKEFLRRFLPDVLTLFFPYKARQLDFDTLQFEEQELIITLPQQVLRITDIVATVNTKRGERETLLIHAEVERNPERRDASLDQRMFEYYGLLRLLKKMKVLPIAIVLHKNVGGLRWKRYTEKTLGRNIVTMHYGQVGLYDLDYADYFDPTNPVAVTLATLMESPPEKKAEIKLEGYRAILASDLTETHQRFLMRVIDTYLPLSELPHISEDVMFALQEMELHWSEVLEIKSLEQGLEQGKIEGHTQLLLSQMRAKFGVLPMGYAEQIKALNDIAALEKVGLQLLTANSLDAIQLPESSPAKAF